MRKFLLLLVLFALFACAPIDLKKPIMPEPMYVVGYNMALTHTAYYSISGLVETKFIDVDKNYVYVVYSEEIDEVLNSHFQEAAAGPDLIYERVYMCYICINNSQKGFEYRDNIEGCYERPWCGFTAIYYVEESGYVF